MDKKKKITGRKALDPQTKRKKYDYYLNNAEYIELSKSYQDSGYKQLGTYVRDTLLKKNKKSAKHINPILFLKDIKALALEVNKIGVNINQLARHVNELKMQNIIPVNSADAINEKLAEYIVKQDQINAKLKEVIKK